MQAPKIPDNTFWQTSNHKKPKKKGRPNYTRSLPEFRPIFFTLIYFFFGGGGSASPAPRPYGYGCHTQTTLHSVHSIQFN